MWVALIGCERELVLLSCETVIINSYIISLSHVLFALAPPLPSATTIFDSDLSDSSFAVTDQFAFPSPFQICIFFLLPIHLCICALILCFVRFQVESWSPWTSLVNQRKTLRFLKVFPSALLYA